PLVVSYAPYLMGAALSWSSKPVDRALLQNVLSRDVFHDRSGNMVRAALGLGFAHRHLKYFSANTTPLGSVIAAPPPAWRELVCRDGLKYYARIHKKNIRKTLEEVERQREVLQRAKPQTESAAVMKVELDMAARMAAQSCGIMLWQQAVAA